MTSRAEVVISSDTGSSQILSDLWRYRDLLMVLTWRNISVRYKQAVIGLAWVVLRPLIMLAIYTAIFSRLAKLPDPSGKPYSILILSGLIVWLFFTNAVGAASVSFLADAALISKVYIPRILLPLSYILSGLADFLVTVVLLGLLMLYMHVVPPLTFIFFPLVILHLTILTSAIGLLSASLTVRYRDLNHLIPFVLQVGFYATPVVYSSTLVPQRFLFVYFLNPIAGIVDAVRWTLLGQAPNWISIGESLLVTVVLLTIATVYYRSSERRMADYL